MRPRGARPYRRGMRPLRLHAPLALALACALLTAAATGPAVAKPVTKKRDDRVWYYALTVRGEATYSHKSSQPAIGGREHTTTDEVSFGWSTSMRRVGLMRKHILAVVTARTRLSSVVARREIVVPLPEGQMVTTCAGTSGVAGQASLDQPLLTSLVGKVDLDLRLFDSVELPLRCTGQLAHEATISLPDKPHRNGEVDEWRYQVPLEIETDEFGKGKLIHLFDVALPRDDVTCPKQEEQFSVACSMRLRGEITLRRTGSARRPGKPTGRRRPSAPINRPPAA